jgi:UDP-N-acetylmuramyl pentapeptide phosphotransferase/UDP-N-acetylglucosamine-1-phosphate transferase
MNLNNCGGHGAERWVKPFNKLQAMTIPSFLIVACTSLVVSLLLVLTKSWHGHFSMDHTDGVQKFHAVPTPRIGGIAIFAGLVAGWHVVSDVENVLLAPLLIASIPAFVFGLLEDVTKRVGVLPRLLATMGSGVLACWLTGIALNRADVPMLDDLLKYWPIAVVFTAFAVAGIANAINIIDGFNGLSSGAVMIILASLGSIAKFEGDTVLATNFLLLGAAIFGFWIVNFPFGKLFLGDGGAYFAGFALAWLAVLLMMRNPRVSPWLVLLASAYPVIEVLYSIWRRACHKQKTGAPDNLHLHSLIKTRVTLPGLGSLSPELRNAAVSPFLWCFTAIPSGLAVLLTGAGSWMAAAAFFACVAVYRLLHEQLLGARSQP